MSFPIGVKTKAIFSFSGVAAQALEKDKLPLNKLMPSRAQFGVLSSGPTGRGETNVNSSFEALEKGMLLLSPAVA